MARLRVVKGKDAGKVFQLPAFEWVIGRGTTCDVIVDDPRMSRQHACIRLHRGTWMVRDLGSAGGTFVNGAHRGKNDAWTPIREGSKIRFGHTLVVFEEVPEHESRNKSKRPAPAAKIRPLPDHVEIPGHRVYDKVGDGATGTVYRGRHLQLDRPVAIKILSPLLATKADFVARFEQEARAAAELSHPHVIPVYHVGQYQGLHFFTMELMEQGTVEDRLAAAPDSRLPWPEAVKLASETAAGLAHIHQHGLVHRDIKPANLLLDTHGSVKLGDLGTLVPEAEAQGKRIGTPHFMSPEQARREPVTRASDVYSLGATLYRMLTGHTPHGGETLRDVVRAVAHDVPAPIEAVREGLPAVVADEINAMMARDPADRPADAGEVAVRLQAALRDVHDHRRMRRQSRRRKATTQDIVIRLALLLAVAGAIFVLREPIVRGFSELASGASSASANADAPPATPDPSTSGVGPDVPPVERPEPVTAEQISSRFATIQTLEKTRPPIEIGGAAINATWREIAREYEDFVDSHPLDAVQVRLAAQRAREIQYELAAVEPASARVAADVDKRLAADFERMGAGAVTAGEPAIPSLRVIQGGVLDPLRDARTTTLRRAAAQQNDGQGAAAMAAVTAWVAAERALLTGDQSSKGAQTIDAAVDWLRHAGRILAVRLEYDVDRDARLLASHMGETGFFAGLDGLADPIVALERLQVLESFMATPLGRARCRERRERLIAARETWVACVSSGATPESVADAIVERSGTVPREHLDGALWLLLETGRRYRAEELLSERRLNSVEAAATFRAHLAALREFATMGDAPAPSAVVAWSRKHPGVDLVLVGGAGRVPDFRVFSDGERNAYLDAWGADDL